MIAGMTVPSLRRAIDPGRSPQVTAFRIERSATTGSRVPLGRNLVAPASVAGGVGVASPPPQPQPLAMVLGTVIDEIPDSLFAGRTDGNFLLTVAAARRPSFVL